MTDAPTMAAIPPPIPGERLDPPPKLIEATLEKVDQKSAHAGGGYRAFLRFGYANAALLAAGTAYYIFLSVFALLAFAFGLTAVIGGERLADALTQAVSNAFPGLIGDQGLSPETLMEIGQTTSIVGLLVLLYSGSGAITAASKSIHLIYGAPKDPRNFVLGKVRLLGWLLVLAPLIAISFIPNVALSVFAEPVLDFLNLEGEFTRILLVVLTGLLSIALNALVVWLMLGHLGGIRPARGPRLAGTIIGALGIEVLKYLLSFIIGWSVGKPQYGAFAAPIAMLFVLYLETIVVYASASITAGMAVAHGDPQGVPQQVETLPA
ncbi:MAG: YihY/virulence factor BrkB family protein [Candidatus Nanopelagicales bacterium]|jgi:membrane protein|nr:YihY/virulence factor BrkB family protein [Candidatus Nanopelagicales bacterium]